jgi:hypothetical protein
MARQQLLTWGGAGGSQGSNLEAPSRLRTPPTGCPQNCAAIALRTSCLFVRASGTRTMAGAAQGRLQCWLYWPPSSLGHTQLCICHDCPHGTGCLTMPPLIPALTNVQGALLPLAGFRGGRLDQLGAWPCVKRAVRVDLRSTTWVRKASSQTLLHSKHEESIVCSMLTA